MSQHGENILELIVFSFLFLHSYYYNIVFPIDMLFYFVL